MSPSQGHASGPLTMNAAVLEDFGAQLTLRSLARPSASRGTVVVRVFDQADVFRDIRGKAAVEGRVLDGGKRQRCGHPAILGTAHEAGAVLPEGVAQ